MSGQPRVYSERLGVIRDEQFAAALARHGLGTFVSAEPIPVGLFGQNVFVTSTCGQFVLRGKPHWEWQFPKERCFARLLHERTDVPVPWPYLLDESTDIFGWSYVLMPRMPGVSPCDPEHPLEDQLGIALAAGRNLAMAQQLTWPEAGEYAESAPWDRVVPYAEGYAARLIGWLRQDLKGAVALAPAVTEGDVPWVEELLAGAERAWADGFSPCFVMNDYKLNNMTAQRVRAHEWRISGMFDLMECRFGDGESDLVRQIYTYLSGKSGHGEALARAFGRGYRQTRGARALRPGFAKRFTLHMLLDRLAYWCYGHGPGVNWFEPAMTFRQYAEPWVHRWDVLVE